MTLKELAIKLGKSEVTLKKAFPRTQENLAKKGIIITKTGHGDNADFTIEYKERNIK